MTASLTLLLCLGSAPSAAQGLVAPAEAVEGEVLPIQALSDGAPVRGLAIKGTWWPDALDASLARVGTTDAQGQVEWTPTRAGPILLEGDQHDSLVRVRPPRANPLAWGILALLGLAPSLLFLGLLRSVHRRWLPGRPTPEST